jgi:hypothetical protein
VAKMKGSLSQKFRHVLTASYASVTCLTPKSIFHIASEIPKRFVLNSRSKITLAAGLEDICGNKVDLIKPSRVE